MRLSAQHSKLSGLSKPPSDGARRGRWAGRLASRRAMPIWGRRGWYLRGSWLLAFSCKASKREDCYFRRIEWSADEERGRCKSSNGLLLTIQVLAWRDLLRWVGKLRVSLKSRNVNTSAKVRGGVVRASTPDDFRPCHEGQKLKMCFHSLLYFLLSSYSSVLHEMTSWFDTVFWFVYLPSCFGERNNLSIFF